MSTVPDSSLVVYIYALCDPDSGDIRYVGKSNRPLYRFMMHCTPRQLRPKSPKNSWIKSLHAQGKRPRLKILCCGPMAEWQSLEMRWIAAMKRTGCDLKNITPGGDSGPCPESTKEKLRAANLGKKYGPRSPDTGRKISLALTGKRLSSDHIAKMAASKRGKPSWSLGIPMREETKAKLSFNWRVVSPDGVEMQVRNLKQFCKDHGLQDSLMHHVSRGKRKNHKGWLCFKGDEET